MFKFFPVTITNDGRKIPLIKDWQKLATNDPEQLRMWQELFRDRLHVWGVPTGKDADLLVLDIDIKNNGWQTIIEQGIQIPQTLSQRTRSGGSHFFFRYPKDGKLYGNRTGIFKTPAKKNTGIDVRGEGGFVAWYGLEVNASLPILEPPTWFTAQAVAPVIDNSGHSIKVAPEIAEGILKTSLDKIREAPPGEANNTINVEAFRVGQLVAAGSLTYDYAFDVLMSAARARGKGEQESKATINSGLNGGRAHPLTAPFPNEMPVPQMPMVPPAPEIPERWTPQYFTRSDLLNTSRLRKPQLFRDWSTEDIAITTADGGTGKTTMKLYEAICLALGIPFLGFQCMGPGKTLFITGEDTDKKLGAMLGAIIKQMGLFEEGIEHEQKIQTILSSIVIKKDADLCLIQKTRDGFLRPDSSSMKKIMEAVEDIKPRMIVFDPIASFWGSENALNDMNKAVTKFASELVERSNACVEMINHMGKSSSAQKDMSQFAGRGGSGLPSNSRVSRVLRSIPHEEFLELTGETLDENKTAMICNVNKFSDGSPLYNKPFLIIRDGYLFKRKDLSKLKVTEVERELPDAERIFAFVKDARAQNKYPTYAVIEAHFMLSGDTIPAARIKRAVALLNYNGMYGEKLKLIDNPDQSIKEKAYTIVDGDGKEI